MLTIILNGKKRKQTSKNQCETVLSSISTPHLSQVHKARERNKKGLYKQGSDKLSLFSDDDATVKSSNQNQPEALKIL